MDTCILRVEQNTDRRWALRIVGPDGRSVLERPLNADSPGSPPASPSILKRIIFSGIYPGSCPRRAIFCVVIRTGVHASTARECQARRGATAGSSAACGVRGQLS